MEKESYFKYKGLGLSDDRKTLSEESEKRLMHSLLNNMFYLSNTEKLNDPTEGIPNFSLHIEIRAKTGYLPLDEKMKIEAFIYKKASQENIYSKWKKTISNAGVFSLSKTPIDELMWAHYANSHQGIVIEYDKNSLIKKLVPEKVKSFDVIYSDEPPTLGLTELQHSKDTSAYIEKYLKVKSKRWEYEKEYRIVVEDTIGLIEHDKEAIISITFGLKLNKEVKDYIVQEFKTNNFSCLFYEISLRVNTYKFERKKYEAVSR